MRSLLNWGGSLLVTLSLPLVASDGRIEINQTSVQSAGGFPYTITASGSYVLTGSLTVPAATDGIIIDTSEVILDLNGFSITGPATCIDGACPAGSGEGIRPDHPIADGHRSTVHNGIIRGFGSTCLRLGTETNVRDMLVSQCGISGISVNARSVVESNRVYRTGQTGIQMSPSAMYAFNNVSEAGLGGGGHQGINGGQASANNVCDDGSCHWVDNRRRFYLTQDLHMGGDALAACASGFHMATLWELTEPGNLHYDTNLGEGASDMGSGPPSTSSGWIRTGYFSGASPIPGRANCNLWTTSGEGVGTVLGLSVDWNNSATIAAPWEATLAVCGATVRVWCVEN